MSERVRVRGPNRGGREGRVFNIYILKTTLRLPPERSWPKKKVKMEGLKFYSSAQAEGFQLAGIARLLFPHYYYYNNNKLGEREKKKLRLGATSFGPFGRLALRSSSSPGRRERQRLGRRKLNYGIWTIA